MAEPPAVQVPDGRKFTRVPTEMTMPRQNQSTKSQLQHWQSPSLPQIQPLIGDINFIQASIGEQLHRHAIENPKKNNHKFLPPKLFDHLFNQSTVRRVIDALVHQEKLPVSKSGIEMTAEEADVATKYWTDTVCGNTSSGLCYRYLFATLVLAGIGELIQNFINNDVTDKELPLKFNEGSVGLSILKDIKHVDLFVLYQKMLTVPFLTPKLKEGEVRQVVLESGDIEPWYKTGTKPQIPSSSQASNSISSTSAQLNRLSLGGGFADVYQILIHPWQHDFHSILRSLSVHENLFALKRLFSHNKVDFEQETLMLKRFGGHPNIITLLATITIKIDEDTEEYYLLFPWAEGDLLTFWQRTRRPRMEDHNIFKWIFNQILEIVRAIDYIHDPKPPKFDDRGEQLYGRHGDIKPENILWCKSDNAETLVISDLGLSVTNSKNSRSNRLGADILVTPDYRPPECDIDGVSGKISRSFDIWTLGCLLLEFVVWILNGWQGREEFRERRFSQYINGISTDIFFEVRPAPGDSNEAIFMIKDSVEEEFDRLHQHKDCTQYLHDLLYLIQDHMLILESDKEEGRPAIKRILSHELYQKIERINRRCNAEKDYYSLGCPRNSTHTKKEPVRAKLNKRALALCRTSNMNVRVPKFEGRTRTFTANSQRSSTKYRE